ncbi:hypothetical protein QA601_05935 [Chitinispirillales bacterium ANBcel5]|uniref:hypothetical protein n=1 Tax=Cellulosispirillum alkaliphilum TaxID=3039283 RepID=UPI002A56EA19|nr:hypothetical protein [Chitinispirillales bacterium ANBcel5]
MKAIAYFKENGFILMMVGFAILIIGLITVMSVSPANVAARYAAIGASVLGFAIYIVGRIFVAMKKNQKRKIRKNDEDEAHFEPKS